MIREKLCLVCYEQFDSVRRDAKFCGDACRQKACRDKKNKKDIYQLPKYLRYRVIHYKDAFTLSTSIPIYKYVEWIHSEKALYRVQESMIEHDTCLFVCTNQSDILKVVELIGD